MLYFSEGGSKVQVEYYSTIQEKWFLSDNQFTFDLAVVGRDTNTDENNTGAKVDQEDNDSGVVIIVVGAVVLVVALAVAGTVIYKKRKSQN